jgi:hypothetical protein
MQYLVRTFLLLSAILVIGCASAPSGKSFDSPIGEWSSNIEAVNGRWMVTNITIIDETKGTYALANGQLAFYSIDDQRKWEGYFIDETVGHSCPDKKNGSYYWGVVIFQFDDAYTRFSGKYDICGEGHTYDWDGYR